MNGIAVVDTNVVAAALTMREQASPVGKILAAMLGARIRYALSMPLLGEYRDVLRRVRIQRAHGLSATEVDDVLVQVARHAIIVEAGKGPPAPDPGDQLLWDIMAVRPEFVLVTGDAALRRSQDWAGRVVSPREFVEAFLPDARHRVEEPGATGRRYASRALSQTAR